MDSPLGPLELLTSVGFEKCTTETASKIAFLGAGGADPYFRNGRGESYLRQILVARAKYSGTMYESLVTKAHDGQLKDVLMLLVTAGADVFAVNRSGESVSDVAIKLGYSVEWKETLEECGYDVSNVLNHSDEHDEVPRQHQQRHLLTFAEYLQEVYRRYYRTAVPKHLRIKEMDSSDSSDSEEEEDEDDFGEQADGNSDAESFHTTMESANEDT
ncbi:hypothetical protein Z517_02126 [Fonsecaea pedrosoi CBS 271.37]|uniref:Uncharacterized protein n=1 Tax=Fonsecaea pedrosoi CBS 271.37 TaxID=1442368 RepID=A0A0D2GPH7_9EURO|nr:uncharacterized protein Z517_02126 [Fonsecaea pedrosoi CBS 271.37]KIW82883.1 hypothetical protein Z517_02126 [Fonsecaea pedrosoi CBS 271.37]